LSEALSEQAEEGHRDLGNAWWPSPLDGVREREENLSRN
jgi:hypothetical protein